MKRSRKFFAWLLVIISVFMSVPVYADAGGTEGGEGSGAGDNVTITVIDKYYDSDNALVNQETRCTDIKAVGESYSYSALTVAGYEVTSNDTISGVLDGSSTSIEVVFEYKELYHDVIFHAEGGTFSDGTYRLDLRVLDGSLLTEPEAPTRDGYVFTGWLANLTSANWNFASDTVTKYTYLAAQWREAYHTVTFDTNGGTFSDGSTSLDQQVADDSYVIEPEVPTKEGYTFLKWYLIPLGQTWNFDSYTVISNITLKASWVENPTVTFDTKGGEFSDGSTSLTQQVVWGSLLTEPEEPTRDGYVFKGWYCPTYNYDCDWSFTSNTVKSNITLTAKWQEINTDHTIIFDTKGGEFSDGSTSLTQQVADGSLATEPEVPTRDGYTFKGWLDCLGYEWDFTSNTVTSSNTLYAWWKANPTVTFNTNGGIFSDGSTSLTQQVADGSLATEPEAPTRDGCVFEGWYWGRDKWNFNSNTVEEDITLNAQWQWLNFETVTFNTNGGTFSDGSTSLTQQVLEGNYATEPETPTRDGYVFDGWYESWYGSGGAKWDFTSNTVTFNMTLKAKWQVLYTVTFNTNGGTFSDGSTSLTQQVVGGSLLTEPEIPTRDGYVFDRWYRSAGGIWDFTSNTVTSSENLYVWWKELYTVTFDTAGGTFSDGSTTMEQQVADGDYATEPEIPTREGYKFFGWRCSYNYDWDFTSYTISSNTDLIAQWYPNPIVTFDTNGGIFSDGSTSITQQVLEGDYVTEPEVPTREGFVFEGWYRGSDKWDFTTNIVSGDKTLTAKWQEINTDHTVTFDTNGGTFSDGSTSITQQVADGGYAAEPEVPTREGYKFINWSGLNYLNGVPRDYYEWDFDRYTVTEDKILYAQWRDAYHTVTFDAAGGTFGDGLSNLDQQVADDTFATRPEDPTMEGAYFMGWTTDSSLAGLKDSQHLDSDCLDRNITGDIVMYAKYVPAVTYTVVDHFLDSNLNEVAVIKRGDNSFPKGANISRFVANEDKNTLGGTFDPDNIGILWSCNNILTEDRYGEYNALGLPVDASEIYKSYCLYRYEVNGGWSPAAGYTDYRTHAEGTYPLGNLQSIETVMDTYITEDTQIDYYYWLIPETKLTVTKHFGVLDENGNFIENDSSVEEIASTRSVWASEVTSIPITFKRDGIYYDFYKATLLSKSNQFCNLRNSWYHYMSDTDAANLNGVEAQVVNLFSGTIKANDSYSGSDVIDLRLNSIKYYLFETANIDVYSIESSMNYRNIKVIDKYLDEDGSLLRLDTRLVESKRVGASYSYSALSFENNEYEVVGDSSYSGTVSDDMVIEFVYKKCPVPETFVSVTVLDRYYSIDGILQHTDERTVDIKTEGETYSYSALSVDGYVVTSEETYSGVANSDITIVFTYSEDEARFVTVKGFVTYEDGTPIANKRIEIHSTPKYAVTDENGYYEVNNVEVGNHSFTIFANEDPSDSTPLVTCDLSVTKPDEDTVQVVFKNSDCEVATDTSVTDELRIDAILPLYTITVIDEYYKGSVLERTDLRLTDIKKAGREYSYNALNVEGYTPTGTLSYSGTCLESLELRFKYLKDVVPEPEVPSEPETEPETTPEVPSEPETTPEVSSEPETTPEVSSEPETEPETTPEVPSEPETTPEVPSEPETTPEAPSEPETTPEVPSEPETTPEVPTEPESEVPTETEPETTSEVTTEPETEPTTEPEVQQYKVTVIDKYVTGNKEYLYSAYYLKNTDEAVSETDSNYTLVSAGIFKDDYDVAVQSVVRYTDTYNEGEAYQYNCLNSSGWTVVGEATYSGVLTSDITLEFIYANGFESDNDIASAVLNSVPVTTSEAQPRTGDGAGSALPLVVSFGTVATVAFIVRKRRKSA